METFSDFTLDHLKTAAGRFLLNEITPIIARKGEEARTGRAVEWASEVAFAMVSGVLLRLALTHRPDLAKFFEQAVVQAKKFALEDKRQHPGDYLLERLDRWCELLNQPPRVVHRRSKRTGERTPLKLQALLMFEQAVEFVAHWRGKDENAIRDALCAEKQFKGLKADGAQEIAEVIADGTMLDNEIALELSAKVLGIATDTFERHYLRGARKEAKELDQALKI